MRLSLKRLLIFFYLIICALLSFINYRHTFSTTDYESTDATVRTENGNQIVDHSKMDQSITTATYNQTPSLWQKLKFGFMNELAAAMPNRIFLPSEKFEKNRKIDIRDSTVDRALWPEESNVSDRIVAQIEFRLGDPVWNVEKLHWISGSGSAVGSGPGHEIKSDKNPDFKPKKSILIYLPHGLRSWNVQKGGHEFTRQQCRVSNCELSDWKSDADRADAVVFRNHFLGGFTRHSENQIWIFYTLESPENTPSLLLFKDSINWTATYRFDSDLVTPYEKFRLFSKEEQSIQKKLTDKFGKSKSNSSFAQKKTKQVAWFVSNCLTSNRRHEYVQQLSRHIQVDIYGTCGPHKCSRYDPKCARLLDDDYRFYLAFENSNCRDYITEKLFVQGLQYNIIPIVMGARKSDYARVAPPHSFIHVDDFKTPADLADYLHVLSKNETLYNAYFRWKGTGEFINTKFWCRLCAMLNAPRKKFYRDIERWWHRPGICTQGRWEAPNPQNGTINLPNRASDSVTIDSGH